MRVIVTRPRHAGARTAEKLRLRGHDPLLLPLSEPLHDPKAAECALQHPYSAIAVTSAEALKALQKLGDGLSRHFHAPIFCVGAATAKAAAAAGFIDTRTGGGNGADLALRILADWRDNGPHADPLLYLAGQPRSPALEQALADAKLPVRTVECYRMRPVEHDPDLLHALLRDPSPEAILFYSRETVARFLTLEPFANGFASLGGTRFYCLSAQIAAALPPSLSERALVAASADEEALLDLL